ncbi:MAG: fatty acid desaturase [Gammaproteobacteria bacterium]|nr:fatty acid desaturase [Gammaproteobacteria bacterium]
MQTTIEAQKAAGIFRHKEDRWPVMVVLMLTALDFYMYFTVSNLTVLFSYYLLMLIPKGIICAWNHHHQHIFTFRNTALNRGLEFAYALHTGVTTHLWRLHHVLGHHLNFLDQEKDESRWKRKNGKKMGMIEYTLNVAITAYSRGYTVGKRYPKQLKPFLIYTTITFLIVALLVWYKPVAGFMLFVLPMITSLLFTAYATYDHHSGLDTENEFEASRNKMSPVFNFLTGNLGYHTAHHHKQGVHWSKLPALHEKIKDKIPEYLYQKPVINI